MKQKIKEKLEDSNYRMTGQRAAILEVMIDNQESTSVPRRYYIKPGRKCPILV